MVGICNTDTKMKSIVIITKTKQNMSRNPINARLLSTMLLTGALVLTGCSDNDYDLDQIDATVGIGGDGLEIPASTTEEIKLKDVLDLEENGSVVEDETTHDYVFRQNGDPISPIKVSIQKIRVAQESGTSIPFSFSISNNAMQKGAKRASATVHADADIYKFSYSGNKPKEVLTLLAADATTTLSLNVPLNAISSAVPKLNDLTITLPSYLKFNVGNCSATPTVDGSKLVFTNVPTNGTFKVNVNVTGLDLSSTATSGSISIDNKINLEGRIHLTANGSITGTLSSVPNIEASFNMAAFTINSATGTFDPDINMNEGLGNADITGIPDFLTDKDVKVDLYNPQILLNVSNDMDAEGTITGKIISRKDGRVINTIDGVKIPVAANSDNKICINRTGEAKAGYAIVRVANLSDAIITIPDNIEFQATAKVNTQKVTKFQLGHDYTISPSYKIEAPLAFAENAEIVYKDTLDDWNDDLKDLELAENTYLSATANVANGVPAYLSVDATPVDINKKPLSGIKIEMIKKDVAASPNGTDKVSSPLEIKITQTETGALKKLDGLIFTAAGKAKNGDKAVTGITLNAEKHTLKVTDIKIKIVGKVIGDFN